MFSLQVLDTKSNLNVSHAQQTFVNFYLFTGSALNKYAMYEIKEMQIKIDV